MPRLRFQFEQDQPSNVSNCINKSALTQEQTYLEELSVRGHCIESSEVLGEEVGRVGISRMIESKVRNEGQMGGIQDLPGDKFIKEIKSELTKLVVGVSEEIQKELKVRDVLKKQITMLKEQQHNSLSKLSPVKKKPQIQSSTQYQTTTYELNQDSSQIKQQQQAQLISSKQQNHHQQQNKQQKQKQTQQQNKTSSLSISSTKTRSIKSELLTKGYPVNHKSPLTSEPTSNKNKLPFRFRVNI